MAYDNNSWGISSTLSEIITFIKNNFTALRDGKEVNAGKLQDKDLAGIMTDVKSTGDAKYAPKDSPMFVKGAGSPCFYVANGLGDIVTGTGSVPWHGIGINTSNKRVGIGGYEGVDVNTGTDHFKWNNKQIATVDSPTFTGLMVFGNTGVLTDPNIFAKWYEDHAEINAYQNGVGGKPLVFNGYGGNVGVKVKDPKATFHSTGSTIIGADSSKIDWSFIGNNELAFGIDLVNKRLILYAKGIDGTMNYVFLPFVTF